MPRSPDRRRLVAVLFAASGILATGYGVVFTMLDDFRDRYGASGSSLGMLIGGGLLGAFAGQVLLAPQADRGRARQLLLGGLGVNVLGLLVLGLGHDFRLLVLARTLGGFGGGAALPAIRRIVIVSDPEHLGGNLGRMLSIDVAGFATGPVVSTVLGGPFGIGAPFLAVAAATAAVTAAIVFVRVPETPVEDRPEERFALDLLRVRPIAGACLVGIAFFVMIGTFDSLWALVMDDLGAPAWMANVGVTVFALPLVVFGTVGGRVAQRFGPLRVGTIGLAVASMCVVAYGVVPQAWMMLAVGLVHTVNDAFTATGTGIAVANAAPPERQAAAQGLLGGLQTLAGGAVATVIGVAYEHVGRAGSYLGAAVLMLVLVGAGNVLARSGRRDGVVSVTTGG